VKFWFSDGKRCHFLILSGEDLMLTVVFLLILDGLFLSQGAKIEVEMMLYK